jgi:hypothetical protein
MSNYKSDQITPRNLVRLPEDVSEVDPDLVVRDDRGDIYTVRYEAVNAMLPNEFLKEDRRVKELKSDTAKQAAAIIQQGKDLQATIANLVATLNEQASQIEKGLYDWK